MPPDHQHTTDRDEAQRRRTVPPSRRALRARIEAQISTGRRETVQADQPEPVDQRSASSSGTLPTRLVPLRAAAEQLAVSEETVRRLIRRGSLVGLKIPSQGRDQSRGRWRVDPSSVERFLERAIEQSRQPEAEDKP